MKDKDSFFLLACFFCIWNFVATLFGYQRRFRVNIARALPSIDFLIEFESFGVPLPVFVGHNYKSDKHTAKGDSQNPHSA